VDIRTKLNYSLANKSTTQPQRFTISKLVEGEHQDRTRQKIDREVEMCVEMKVEPF
jgi:hypothetical protein